MADRFEDPRTPSPDMVHHNDSQPSLPPPSPAGLVQLEATSLDPIQANPATPCVEDHTTRYAAFDLNIRNRFGDQQMIVKDFAKAFAEESRRATFTCSGRIDVTPRPESIPNSPSTNARVHEQKTTGKPVTIRWGPDGHGRLVALPLTTPQDCETLKQLIKDCEPAIFGRGGQDVYDETYRRAGAMADFTTNFCPTNLASSM